MKEALKPLGCPAYLLLFRLVYSDFSLHDLLCQRRCQWCGFLWCLVVVVEKSSFIFQGNKMHLMKQNVSQLFTMFKNRRRPGAVSVVSHRAPEFSQRKPLEHRTGSTLLPILQKHVFEISTEPALSAVSLLFS